MNQIQPETDTPVNVPCLKWWSLYPASYVNILHRAVRQEMYRSHDFSGYDIPLVDSRNAVGTEHRPSLYFKA